MHVRKCNCSTVANAHPANDSYTVPTLIIIIISIQHTVRFVINKSVFKMSWQSSFIVRNKLHNFPDEGKKNKLFVYLFKD